MAMISLTFIEVLRFNDMQGAINIKLLSQFCQVLKRSLVAVVRFELEQTETSTILMNKC